ncbi:MAG: hypothetical protein GY822_05465 [Deltaproteobacteria bacterium]|nr:hypothetical protein [Deltaproteobacteria bacterium]
MAAENSIRFCRPTALCLIEPQCPPKTQSQEVRCTEESCVEVFECGARLYCGRKREALFPGPCNARFDIGGDGSFEYEETYEYDALQRLSSTYRSGNGHEDWIERSYNEAGDLSETTQSSEPNSRTFTTVYSYDDEDRLRLLEYLYDDVGPVLRFFYAQEAEVPFKKESASNEEADADWVWEYTYDDDDHLISEKFSLNIPPLDESPYIEVTTYNNLRLPLSLRRKYENEGYEDYDVRWTHDEQHRKIIEEIDRGFDGSIEQKNTWTYDAFGNLREKFAANEHWIYDFSCWE